MFPSPYSSVHSVGYIYVSRMVEKERRMNTTTSTRVCLDMILVESLNGYLSDFETLCTAIVLQRHL